MIQGPLAVVVEWWSSVHFSSDGYLTMENQDKNNLGKNTNNLFIPFRALPSFEEK